MALSIMSLGTEIHLFTLVAVYYVNICMKRKTLLNFFDPYSLTAAAVTAC